MAPITAFYAALLCPIFLVLLFRVIVMRYRVLASIGDHGNQELQQRIRAHGNFVEFVAFGLVLIALIEINDGAAWYIHLVGASLLVGRIAHAAAFWAKMNFGLRRVGMVLSILSVALAAPYLLILAFI